MKRTAWILLALLAACGDPPRPAEPLADAIATWNGGGVGFAEVESDFATSRVLTCLKARRGGGLEELVPCYRELAEGIALEALVLAEVGDLDRALEDLGEDGEDFRQLRRHAFRDVYLRRLRLGVEISDAEIEAAYAADPESFRRPGQLTLSNIFRRHEDPARPQATEAFLRGIKQHFEAGETFDALAREVSHSETRLRGGQVGRVSEDDLPARLARVAFALGDGEVSEPVRVEGGAVLLYVQGVVDGVEPSLEQARGPLRRQLTTRRVEQAIVERVAGREPPPGSRVLGLEELVSALDGDDPEAAVLEVGGDRLSAGDFRRLAGLGPRDSAAAVDAEGRDRLADVYYWQEQQALLALELVDSADAELRQEAEEHLRKEAVSLLVDRRIQGEMARGIDAEEQKLRSYFDDNRHHYQSPLRFKLRLWSLPFGDDPPAQLRRMEALRDRLAAGELELEAAAAELGGSVEDLGWREFDRLEAEIPSKARTYLMEVGERGWSVPYQQDDALHLIRLDGRDDPRPLEYQEAAERVREDYLRRFERELYRRTAGERLNAAGFVFDEDAVRRSLAPEEEPSVADPTEG